MRTSRSRQIILLTPILVAIITFQSYPAEAEDLKGQVTMDMNLLKASLPQIMTAGTSYNIDIPVWNDSPRDVEVEIELVAPMRYFYQDMESTQLTLRPGERKSVSFSLIPHKLSDSPIDIQIFLKQVEGDSSTELQRVSIPIYTIQKSISQDTLLITAILGIAALSTVLVALQGRKKTATQPSSVK